MDRGHQQNKFNNELHQDYDNPEGLDFSKKSSEEIENMNGSPSDDKPKGDDYEGTSGKPASSSGTHTCEYCGRKFPSGKSLGGHKRCHFQVQKKEGYYANNNNNKVPSNDTKSSNEKYSCLVCNKDFSSSNALYGHMRSHPDRLWRGINPPIPSDNTGFIEENKDDEDDHAFSAVAAPVIDASKSLLPSWHKTNKRGREHIFSTDSYKAAETLMFMSKDKWSRTVNLKLPQHVNLNEDANCDNLNGKHTKVEYCVKNMKGASNGTKAQVIASTNVLQDHVSDVDETVMMMKRRNEKRIKLTVKWKNSHSESKDQAVEGQISSHNEKEKNNRRQNNNTGERSLSDSRIRDFDLNETPNAMEDERY